MQGKTIEEYRLLREELHAVKNCITTYTGFLLGGSGVAVLGLGALYQLAVSSGDEAHILLGAGCVSLSLFPPLIYLVLLYKFNSHNRFAGYCKLLSHERRLRGDEVDLADHVVSWEFSMSRLRRCELHREEWAALWKSVRFEGSESPAATRAGEKYAHNERGFLIDQKPRHRAIRALWRALTGGTKSYSWTFPAHTTALFGWITIGFFAVGTIFVLAALRPATLLDMRLSVPSTSAEFLVSGWLITLVIHTFVWYLFGLRMHSVLYGSATVNAYAWRFLPIRAAYLNALNVEPSYVGLEVPPPAR